MSSQWVWAVCLRRPVRTSGSPDNIAESLGFLGRVLHGKNKADKAERTPDHAHWGSLPLRSNPIIGLDLRGYIERYIVILEALLCGLRFPIAVTISRACLGRTTCRVFSLTSTVAVGVAALRFQPSNTRFSATTSVTYRLRLPCRVRARCRALLHKLGAFWSGTWPVSLFQITMDIQSVSSCTCLSESVHWFRFIASDTRDKGYRLRKSGF